MFASRLLPLLKDGDVIWVHDYHFIPLGAYLRQAGSRQKLGFFLHIPWPPMELLLTLPARDHEFVLGKFHASWALLAIGLALTLPLALTVSQLGNLDWGPVRGGLLGALLLGGVFAGQHLQLQVELPA